MYLGCLAVVEINYSLVVDDLALEASKLVATMGPFRGWLEAETFGVDHGYDGHLHVTVWKVGAASAAVVFALDNQVVLVVDPLSVAGRLDGRHHESVFFSQRLTQSSLLVLLVCLNLVVDFVKVASHFSLPVSFTSSGTSQVLGD